MVSYIIVWSGYIIYIAQQFLFFVFVLQKSNLRMDPAQSGLGGPPGRERYRAPYDGRFPEKNVKVWSFTKGEGGREVSIFLLS